MQPKNKTNSRLYALRVASYVTKPAMPVDCIYRLQCKRPWRQRVWHIGFCRSAGNQFIIARCRRLPSSDLRCQSSCCTETQQLVGRIHPSSRRLLQLSIPGSYTVLFSDLRIQIQGGSGGGSPPIGADLFLKTPFPVIKGIYSSLYALIAFAINDDGADTLTSALPLSKFLDWPLRP